MNKEISTYMLYQGYKWFPDEQRYIKPYTPKEDWRTPEQAEEMYNEMKEVRRALHQ